VDEVEQKVNAVLTALTLQPGTPESQMGLSAPEAISTQLSPERACAERAASPAPSAQLQTPPSPKASKLPRPALELSQLGEPLTLSRRGATHLQGVVLPQWTPAALTPSSLHAAAPTASSRLDRDSPSTLGEGLTAPRATAPRSGNGGCMTVPGFERSSPRCSLHPAGHRARAGGLLGPLNVSPMHISISRYLSPPPVVLLRAPR